MAQAAGAASCSLTARSTGPTTACHRRGGPVSSNVGELRVGSTARACFFDASALVKVYATEDGSDLVKPFFRSEPTKYTTPFCFYETLTALKAKWMYRKELTQEQYSSACLSLTAWYGASSRQIKDIDFTSYQSMPMLRDIIGKYQIDASDAFQIISVKAGYFSPLARDSQTVFVTADKRLSEVAKQEGLRTWFVFGGPSP